MYWRPPGRGSTGAGGTFLHDPGHVLGGARAPGRCSGDLPVYPSHLPVYPSHLPGPVSAPPSGAVLGGGGFTWRGAPGVTCGHVGPGSAGRAGSWGRGGARPGDKPASRGPSGRRSAVEGYRLDRALTSLGVGGYAGGPGPGPSQYGAGAIRVFWYGGAGMTPHPAVGHMGPRAPCVSRWVSAHVLQHVLHRGADLGARLRYLQRLRVVPAAGHVAPRALATGALPPGQAQALQAPVPGMR